MRGLTMVLFSFAAGALAGWRLSRRGVTAANALAGRQPAAYTILIVVSAFGLVFYFAPALSWVPTFAAVVGEQLVLDGSRVLAAFALGLMLLLEGPAWREAARRRQLVLGAGVLAIGTGFLTYRAL